jgi:hypothetical protein
MFPEQPSPRHRPRPPAARRRISFLAGGCHANLPRRLNRNRPPWSGRGRGLVEPAGGAYGSLPRRFPLPVEVQAQGSRQGQGAAGSSRGGAWHGSRCWSWSSGAGASICRAATRGIARAARLRCRGNRSRDAPKAAPSRSRFPFGRSRPACRALSASPRGRGGAPGARGANPGATPRAADGRQSWRAGCPASGRPAEERTDRRRMCLAAPRILSCSGPVTPIRRRLALAHRGAEQQLR